MRAWILGCVAMLAGIAFGQTSLVAGVGSAVVRQTPTVSTTYRLQPEDVVRIQVFNQQQIQADLPIGPDGNVAAPFVGLIKASGKTTTELESDIAQGLKRRLQLKDPIVSVLIIRFRPLRATVGGFVLRPSTYEFRPGDTLISLLNQGGGPIPDTADLRRTTLRRQSSRELIPIDLYALLVRGDTTQNFELQDGDELTVPREDRNRVNVLGIVLRPGLYPYREGMTVSDALGLAGGEVRTRSRLSRTIVIRERVGQQGQYQVIPVDMVRFFRKYDQTQNILLLPGDIVFVPETNTPDLGALQGLGNLVFILDRLGSNFLGLRLFRN